MIDTVTSRIATVCTVAASVLALSFTAGCNGEENQTCSPGKTRTCPCVGQSEGVQTCREDGSGWNSCECPDDSSDATNMTDGDQTDTTNPMDTGEDAQDTTSDVVVSDGGDVSTDSGDVDETPPRDPLEPSIQQVGDDQPQITEDVTPIGGAHSAVGGRFEGTLSEFQASNGESGFVVTYDANSRIVSEAVPESQHGATRVQALRADTSSSSSGESINPILMAGTTVTSSGTAQGFVASYDPSETGDWKENWGDWPVDWKTRLGPSDSDVSVSDMALRRTSDGGSASSLVVAGSISDSSNAGGSANPAVWSVDYGSGEPETSRLVDSTAFDAGFQPVRIVALEEGGFVLAGNLDQSGSSSGLVARFDETGDLTWRSMIGIQSRESVSTEITELAVDRNATGDFQGVFAVGSTTGPLGGNYHAGNKDAFVAGFDGGGNRRGVALAGTSEDDEATAILALSKKAYGVDRVQLYGNTDAKFDSSRPKGEQSGLFSMAVTSDADGNVQLDELDADNQLESSGELTPFSSHGNRQFQGARPGKALGDLNGDNAVKLGDLNGDNALQLGDLNGDNYEPQPISAAGSTTGENVSNGASVSDNGDRDTFFANIPSRQIDFGSWSSPGAGSEDGWTVSDSGRVVSTASGNTNGTERLTVFGGDFEFTNRSLLGTMAFPEASDLASGAHAVGVILGSTDPSSDDDFLVWSWTRTTSDSGAAGHVIAHVDGSATVEGLAADDLQNLADSGEAEILARRTCDEVAWDLGRDYEFGLTYSSSSESEAVFGVRLPKSGPGSTRGVAARGSDIPDDVEPGSGAVFAQTDVEVGFEYWRVANPTASNVLNPEKPLTCGTCGVGCTFDQAVASCEAGGCELQSCRGGWGDCDGREVNGCETRTGYSPFNCGTCGNSCDRREICNSGQCEPGPKLALSPSHSCLLKPTGEIYCWGANKKDQLGLENTPDIRVSTPQKLSWFTGASDLALGARFSCAIDSSDAVKCWGLSKNGSLGAGMPSGSTTASPVPVANVSDARSIAAGENFGCAVVQSGEVKCWGLNSKGQLGDGTTENASQAVQVQGISNAVEVAAASSSACARLQGGSVKCWGNGNVGQLGNGDEQGSSTPVDVDNLSTAAKLKSNPNASSYCAVLQGGETKCWGLLPTSSNVSGTLYTSPRKMGNYSDVIDAGVTGKLGCILRSDGRVYCFGKYNTIGDGTFDAADVTASKSDAARVKGLDNRIVELGVGKRHGCAVDVAGEVYCWGANGDGQLGDGQFTHRLSAVPAVDFGPTTSEVGKCSDGMDNDSDGRIDCQESECARDLGSQTGAGVVTDNLCGTGDYFEGGCHGDGSFDADGSELVYRWQAPSDGTFVFDTTNSSARTYVYARENTCSGIELGCDADGPQGKLTLDVSAGDRLKLFVDSTNQIFQECEKRYGSFVLDITKQ